MKDESICLWSTRIDDQCPYKEFLNIIRNELTNKKIRCEGKKCLKILMDHTNTTDELSMVEKIAPDYLRPSGPAYSTKILNNFNIDTILKDFSRASVNKDTRFINGPFYHISFDMRDFMEAVTSELRDINFSKLDELGFKTFGCVLNTDRWSGPGKHWVCIFGTINEKKIDVEYFNSSGRSVKYYDTLCDWREKKIKEGYDLSIKSVVPSDGIQRSETECGVWCLYYIKLRLEGHPPDYFIKNKIKDKDITEARRYLFI